MTLCCLSVCNYFSPDPIAALLNFRSTAQSSTSISVQWDRLTPCKDVNGLIVEFRVQYRALPSGPVQTVLHSVQSEMWNMPVEVSLTGLTPFTNYSIQAAPVNNLSQVGSYSDIAVTQTQDSETTTGTILNKNNHFLLLSSTWSCGCHTVSFILQNNNYLGPSHNP